MYPYGFLVKNFSILVGCLFTCFLYSHFIMCGFFLYIYDDLYTHLHVEMVTSLFMFTFVIVVF